MWRAPGREDPDCIGPLRTKSSWKAGVMLAGEGPDLQNKGVADAVR